MSSILPALHRAAFNDIIFEGRNKLYGAYDLRLIYPRHLKRAALLMLWGCGVVAAGPTALRYLLPAPAEVVQPARPNTPIYETTEPPVFDQPKPPIAQPRQPAQPVQVATQENLTRVIVSDHDNVVEAEIKTMIQLNDGPDIGTRTQVGEAGLLPPIAEEPLITTGLGGTDEVFINVEKMPEFPGGSAALLREIATRMRYPALALRNGVEGRVYAKFVVDETGQVTNISIVKGIGAGCDEEAARVLATLPRFTPGEQNGRPVKVYFNVPISFQIK